LVVLQAKGKEDMGGRSRLHELAAGLKAYVAKNGGFPRGTVDRVAVARTSPDDNGAVESRAGLPWPPDQCVSWMAEVLPYLGQGEYGPVAARLKRGKSWNDPENLQTAQTLIPYFLSNEYPQASWWGLYPDMTVPVANTHFVGVAGVGVEAAEYAAGDPAVAKKLGVFGYDRSTRLAEIADGPDKTIALLQVPADFRTPWLAGGGSTVRGVPEDHSVQPFVCTTYKGKRGTFAVMADGRVRFIPATISDQDFQALCTIAGGEAVDVDKVAPVVRAPDANSVLTTRVAPPAPPRSAPATPPDAPAPAAPPP
jgi:hypothetical protein